MLSILLRLALVAVPTDVVAFQPSFCSRRNHVVPAFASKLQRQEQQEQQHPRLVSSSTKLFSNNDGFDNNISNRSSSGGGSGENWIQKSFHADFGTQKNKIDAKQVEEYDVGISGISFQTGPLSSRMYEAMTSNSNLDSSMIEIANAFKLYAMDFTAKEATRAALNQNKLEMVLEEDDEDAGRWGDVEAIRLYDMTTNEPYNKVYETIDDVLDQWSPGQTFDFVVRQVPAKVKELSVEAVMAALNDNDDGTDAETKEKALDAVLEALDPDGSLREEAKKMRSEGKDPIEETKNMIDEETLLSIYDDEEINSLSDLATINVQRTESAPREATVDGEAFGGSDTKGYDIINRKDLTLDAREKDGGESLRTVMHTMDSLVSHGVLLVDLSNGGTNLDDDDDDDDIVRTLSKMWKTTESFFEQINDDDKNDIIQSLPGMITCKEAGSVHAKIGFASYDSNSLQFLETRTERGTTKNDINGRKMLPVEVHPILGNDGMASMKDAFDVLTQVGKDVIRIVTSASSIEYGAYADDKDLTGRKQESLASTSALYMVNELVDDGLILSSTDESEMEQSAMSASSVSMSPHRLCRYAEGTNKDGGDDNDDVVVVGPEAREVFGAHVDSSFVTIVPVAAISGLEVYDEGAKQWYRPELKARRHWEKEQVEKGRKGDPTELFYEELGGGGGGGDEDKLPWHARYVAIIPGEYLQLVTRNEIAAAVHRVVATKDGPARLSAPILLRGRPGVKMSADRYLGGTLGLPLLEECDGMTMEQIHDATQPSSFE